MFKYLDSLVGKVVGKLGYIKDKQLFEEYDELKEICSLQNNQINGLVFAIGQYAKENDEMNVFLTAVICSTGNEEVVLTRAYVSDILNNQTETVYSEDKDGNLKLTVQLRNLEGLEASEEDLNNLEK